MVSHYEKLEPPNVAEKVEGVSVDIILLSFPGVPERLSCRMQVRTVNRSKSQVALHLMTRTFDSYGELANTWMIPAGDLAPGEESVRVYSCKLSHVMQLDRHTKRAWPLFCMVDGEERSPCPLTLGITTNVDLVAVPPEKH